MTKNADLTEAVMDRIAEHMARRPVPPPEPKPTRGRPCKPSKPRAIGEAKSGEKPTPEREAHGRFTSDTIYAHATDGDGTVLTKRTVETRRRRDADADLRTVLRGRYPAMQQQHPEYIIAAVLLEGDADEAHIEQRVIANLNGVGGGNRGNDTPDRTLDARTRLHLAMEALRLGGEGVVAVVEAVILHRTPRAAGIKRYARGRDQSVYIEATLNAGLSLLAAHYVKDGRMSRPKPSPQEKAA